MILCLVFFKQIGYLKSLKIIYITKTIHTVLKKISIDHPKLWYHRTFLDVKWCNWLDTSLNRDESSKEKKYLKI